MSRKRPAGKPEPRQAGKPVKLTFSVPADVAKRFAHYAVETEVSKTDLFIDLVRTHCNRFVISDRGAGKPAEDAA